MKKKIFLFHVLMILLLLSIPMVAMCAPITYYDTGFEDNTFAGGIVFPGFNSPEIVGDSYLDGNALEFTLNDQMIWSRNGVESITHYISFDYYAEEGANITQFLDVPSILRLDVGEIGRHNVQVFYNLETGEASSYFDNVLAMDMLTILAWPTNDPVSSQIRIANQVSAPGNSAGIFQIDNLVWTGDTETKAPVPEPATLILCGFGLLGLIGVNRRKK